MASGEKKRGWSSRSIRIVTDDTGQIGSLIEVVPTTRQGVVTTKVAPGFKQAVENMATPAGSG